MLWFLSDFPLFDSSGNLELLIKQNIILSTNFTSKVSYCTFENAETGLIFLFPSKKVFQKGEFHF